MATSAKRRTAARSALVLLGGLAALTIALSPLRFSSRDRVARGAWDPPRELLAEGRFEQARPDVWGGTGSGYRLAPGEGREGSQAVVCDGADSGTFQTVVLDQARSFPIRISGWSKAREVDGAPDDDYSLHVSVEFVDGSRLDRVSAEFECGTHDWQRRELLIPALHPVKSLVLHALFRNHRGRVWFDDLSVQELQPESGSILFQGAPWASAPIRAIDGANAKPLETQDGLSLAVRDGRIESLSLHGRIVSSGDSAGFLVRDAARDGAWRPFDGPECRDLRLALDVRWEAERNHVAIEGELRDLAGTDRAVSLAFLVPVDALGWSWADDVRRSRPIGMHGEFVHAVPVPCGATASLSRYPVAALHSHRMGLAIAADPAQPALFRVGYHAEMRRLFISYDFGLIPDAVELAGRARFRFVLYRFDGAEGFRGALEGLYGIFPSSFARRCLESGTWLPFTPAGKIPRWEDFGFAFREAAPGDASIGPEPLRTFRYTEPLGWWTPLPSRIPRAQDGLLARIRALDPAATRLDAVEGSVMKSADGVPRFRFRRQPWCDGILWSMNPNPRLPGSATAAGLWKGDGPGDGDFVDSAEGYAMAELDFDRDHLRHTSVPPTYSSDTRVPVLFKGQMIHEYAAAVARELRAAGKLTFGNGTPHRFAFLAPSFDILGNEVDWFPGGAFVPAGDPDLSYRRALAYQKPICVLLNTKPDGLTPAGLELFFQRCLFYGMFPSLFSHDAQNDSYWENPALYERDRPLFRKYIPLIRRTSVAGWQPVTGARCDNPAIFLERFGPDANGVCYLSLLNAGATEHTGIVTLRKPTASAARELITGGSLELRDGRLEITLPAGAARLLEFRVPAQK